MRIAALLAATLLLAGCASGRSTKTVTVTRTVAKTVTVAGPPAAATPPGQQAATYFGVPVSITQADANRYLLVLKPESFLVGVTANEAFASQQGTACPPLACPGVPDDRLVVPAGRQNLVFVLPATTTGTVITSQMHAATVTAAQLSALLAGATTPKLIEPLGSGLWLRVDVDKVTAFAQQFQP